MSRSDLEYLRHILDEIDYLAAEAPTLSLESFLADETRKRAFVRSIEILELRPSIVELLDRSR